MTKISALSNGIRVVTENVSGYFGGLGVYIHAGSRYEPSHLRGLAHFNEKLAYKNTQNRSRELMSNTIEKLGGNITTGLTREDIMYQGTFFKKDLEQAMELYADTIIRPDISQADIDDTKAVIQWEHSQKIEKPSTLLLPDLLHQAAFSNKTLGHRVSDPTLLPEITLEKVQEFRNLFYRPSNTVVVALGYEHEAIVELAEAHFGQMKAESSEMNVDRVSAEYTGGLVREHDAKSEFEHLLIGFKSPAFNDKDVYAASVLQMMLGGGDSFSAGGPGKGMYSRLYVKVLNQYYWVERIQADHASYSDCGLFSFHAAVPEQALNHMLTVLGTEMHSVMSYPIKNVELDRAKNQLRAALFMNLEAPVVHLEDLGRQIQMNGSRICPREMSQKIEAVTGKDVQDAMRMLVSSPPSYVIHGKSRQTPDFARFEREFGIGGNGKTEIERNFY